MSESTPLSGELHDGLPLGEHSFDVYTPESYEDGVPVPVVIALHGRPAQSVESQAHLQPLADEQEFIVVYPRVGRQRWQLEPGSADIDYMRELITEVTETWNGDPERIYVTGMSAGADMAIAIGLQLSDHVAGVAPVAPPGDSAVEELLDVSDALPPMVAFVGAQDTRFAERSLDLLTELRDSAGCADEQLIEADAVTTSTWKCDEEVEIVTYVLEDEGHVWFGSPDSRDPLWASQAMWEFFSAQ